MLIFDELISHEDRINKLPVEQSCFIRKNTWYANKNFMGTLFSYPFLPSSRKIPGLHRTKVLGLLKNFLMENNAREYFQSNADAIQIKDSGERLRAFYDSGSENRYSTKVVCNSQRFQFIELLQRDIAVRKIIASLGTIKVPEIRTIEQTEKCQIITEEMIMGRRFNGRSDREIYKDHILPQLRNTYLAYGIRYVPLQEFLPADIATAVHEIAEPVPGIQIFQQALKRVVSENSTVASSLCHGGIGPCNLAVANGTVYFLDWKYAQEDLIIRDLFRTAVKYPGLDYFVNDIRQLMTTGFMHQGCRLNDLLTIAIALEIKRVPGSVHKLVAMWHRHVNANGNA